MPDIQDINDTEDKAVLLLFLTLLPLYQALFIVNARLHPNSVNQYLALAMPLILLGRELRLKPPYYVWLAFNLPVFSGLIFIQTAYYQMYTVISPAVQSETGSGAALYAILLLLVKELLNTAAEGVKTNGCCHHADKTSLLRRVSGYLDYPLMPLTYIFFTNIISIMINILKE